MDDMQRAIDLLDGVLHDVHVPGINERDCLMQAFTEVRLDERRAVVKWLRCGMLEAFGLADEKKLRALEAQVLVAAAAKAARDRAREATSSSEVALDAAEQAERHAQNAARRLQEAAVAEQVRVEAVKTIEACKAQAVVEAGLAQRCVKEAREAAQQALQAVDRAKAAALRAENETRGI